MFYLLLSEEEVKRAKNLDVRNCDIKDLTLSEIYLLTDVLKTDSVPNAFLVLYHRINVKFNTRNINEPFDPHYFGNNL